MYLQNDSPGEAATEGGKELRQQAGEIMACEYIVLYQIPICAYLVILYLQTYLIFLTFNNNKLQLHNKRYSNNNNITHEGKQL